MQEKAMFRRCVVVLSALGLDPVGNKPAQFKLFVEASIKRFATVGGPGTIHPAPRGTVIRVAEWAPEPEEIRNLSPEDAREIFKAMGNEGASTYGRGGRHPIMHRTETIDYAVILEGALTLLLDDQDVELKAGDVIIQRGTNHSWRNRSEKPCRILFVLVDGAFDPELKRSFARRLHE